MASLAGSLANACQQQHTAHRGVFQELYCEHFNFVFRNLRRLGVPEPATEDALQEVYLVVLRHIDAYRPGTHPRAWLFAIANRVARTYRRTMHRRRDQWVVEVDAYRSADAGPLQRVERRRARAILHAFLDGLPEAQRMVFIMVELEQMTAPEVSRALGVKLNTVYARLRAARQKFADMVASRRAVDASEP